MSILEEKSSSMYLLSLRRMKQTVKACSLSALLALGILLIVSWFVNYILLYFLGGILFLMSVLMPCVINWIPKERISPDKKAVLITGCDRGFGYMLAQRLDDLGFHVFAGCLFPDGDGASSLRKSGSNRLHVIGLDVTSDNSVLEAASYVKQNLKDNVLWAVVNNAGIIAAGDVHWTSVETIQKIFEVNTLGVVRVTKAFLVMLRESQGRIVTVASTAGCYVFPGQVPYGMSKASVFAFCDGLRLEMYKWGIQVITIVPAVFRTSLMNEEFAKTAFQECEKLSTEEKGMYHPSYLESFVSRNLSLGEFFAKQPSEVVSVMEDALTALYPEYSYSVGSIMFFVMIWALQTLPKPFGDMLVFCVLK